MLRFALICLTLLASLSRPSVLALSIIQNALDNWTEGRTDDIMNAGVGSGTLRLNRNSPSCTDECLKKLAIDHRHKSFSDKNSCSRGCRFQVLAQLLLGNAIKFEKDDPKSDTCQSMCREAYAKSENELKSCQIGCSSYNPSQQTKPVPVIAEFSWSWLIDGGKPAQVLEGDAQEPDDVLTDPSLRSQISKIETLRLPELRLKTIPTFAQDKPVSICGVGSVSGVPYCFVWSFLLLVTLLGLWSCLSLDEQVATPGASHRHHHHHGSMSPGDDVKKVLILKDDRCTSILGLDDDLLEDEVEYLSTPLPLKIPPPPPYSQSA